LRSICSKYGTVVELNLKKKTYDGEQVSTGQATVTFSSKSEAAQALQKLPFETELGDNVQPDIYQMPQGRMKEYEMKNNPLR